MATTYLVTENLLLSDAVSRGGADSYAILVEDSLFLQESISPNTETGAAEIAGDSFTFADDLALSFPYITAAADSISLSDTVSRSIDFFLAPSDILSFSDGILQPLLNFGDIYFLQDAASYSLGLVSPTGLSVLVADGFEYLDGFAYVAPNAVSVARAAVGPTVGILIQLDKITLSDGGFRSPSVVFKEVQRAYIRRYANDFQG